MDARPIHPSEPTVAAAAEESSRPALEDFGPPPDAGLVGTLLARTPDLVVGLGTSGQLRYANRSWCKAMGYAQEEAAGLHLRQVVPGDELSQWIAWLSEDGTVADCRMVRVTWRARGGSLLVVDGALCQCAAEKGGTRLLGIFSASDPYRESRTLLWEPGAALRLLASHAPVGVFQTDAAGRLVRTNARWRKIAGLRHVEEPHGVWWQMVHPTDRPRVLEEWASFLRYGHDFLSEFRVNTEVDVTRHARLRTVRVLQNLPGGQVAPAYVGVTEDVTEQRRLQDELASARHVLEGRVRQRTAQLEAVNAELMQFASVAAHDLKAPLRAVNRLAEWLMMDHANSLNQDGQELCRLLQAQVTRMHRLIEGILDYTRLGQVGEAEVTVNLGAILPSIVEMLAPPANITIELPASLPEVQAVPEQVRQVFQNLLQNAIHYMDKPEGRVAVAAVRQSDGWLFTVRDNGPGIHPRYHEKIFQVFQKLQSGESGKGTGIGLAIVKRLVEGRGGRVWVESTEGQGCTFFFTWPDIPAQKLDRVSV